MSSLRRERLRVPGMECTDGGPFLETSMITLLLVLPLLASEPQVLGEDDVGGMGADQVSAPEGEDPSGSAPIINGTAGTLDDWPAAGGMILDLTAQRQTYRLLMCSSALIAPDVVILAAHCVDDATLAASMYTDSVVIEEVRFSRSVDLSMYDGRSMPEWPADSVAASDWVFHEEYDYRTMQTGLAENHDIALLFLSTPILDVPHDYLITSEEVSQLLEGNAVDVVGWGYQDPAMRGDYGVKMMGSSTISALGDAEFQVGYAQEDVRQCHGDSGGPVYMQVATDSPVTVRHVGLTSHTWDNSQCRKTGGVNTRTDVMLEWIDQQMTSRCEAGTRSWCDVPGIVLPPEPPPPEETGETGDDGEGGGGGGDDKKCGCATPIRPVGGAPLVLALAALGLARRRRG